jgi:hypothetical protein
MDERSERIQRRFEWPMIVAALLVIPALVLQEYWARPSLRFARSSIGCGSARAS